MTYNPKLVEQLLGEKVAELFDGTMEIKPSKDEFLGNLRVGDKFTFKFNVPTKQLKQFIVK